VGLPSRDGQGAASALLRWQFRLAHELLDAAIERLAVEAVERRRPGAATPAGACYARAVLVEDLSVNGVPAARAPLALSTWAGRTGLSQVPRLGGRPTGPPGRAACASTRPPSALTPVPCTPRPTPTSPGCRRACSARYC
jgi:hypothetical protein